MKYFIVFALLATLAMTCSAFQSANSGGTRGLGGSRNPGGSRGYDQRCYRLPASITQPDFETADFRDCLRQPCRRDEICCPKRLGGGRCISIRSFSGIRNKREETPQYDSKCFTLPIKVGGEPVFETTVFRDCLAKEPCASDEICCPKSVGGGKCLKNEFEKVETPKTYDQRCLVLPIKVGGEPVFETTVFRDCLNKEPCASDEICCPKSVGGGKCLKKTEFENVEQPKTYDQRCFSAPLIGNDQDMIETQDFRDCLNKEPCSNDQICCPKKTGGGKCLSKPAEKMEAPKSTSPGTA